ncbi:MAG TPA: cytochrome bd-I oxidase subunit CydX [Steroidobacter sp.]|jgi:cyd operon protein YbgT|nr:cytochrome bd-I oxidase subunit CydX [Steroidobacter sp.]
MWYFTWVLGLGLACSFAILNAMWLELVSDYEEGLASEPPPPPRVDEVH